MIRFLILLIALPSFVFADTISIRAGYKDDYTRLVVSTEVDTKWTVDEGLGSAVIRFEDAIEYTKADEIFDRIPAKRIREISQIDERSIRVDLGCDCTVRSFQWRPSKFVVDFIGDDEIFDRPKFRDHDVAVEEEPTPTQQEMDERPAIAFSEKAEVPDLIVGSLRQKRLEELEQALSQSIGAAASQGFLVPAENADVDVDIGNIANLQGELGDIGLRSKTAFEKNDFERERGLVQSELCPNDEEFDYLYDKEEGFTATLSKVRREMSLAHELDKDKIRQKYAELLLRHGFGLEARQQMKPIAADDLNFLPEVALLVDKDIRSVKLSKLSRCEGTAQLLGVLSSKSNVTLNSEEAKSISRAFLRLAPALQARFKGQLSHMLLLDGHRETARIVFEAPSPYTDLRDADFASVQAELDHGAGKQDLAAPETVDAQDLSHDPKLVAEIMNASLKEGFAPDDSVLSLAEVMAYEFRTEAIGSKLQSLLIENEIAFGDLENAKQRLADSTLDDDDLRSLDNQWMRAVAERGSSNLFLSAAFERQPIDVPKDIRVKFANRVLESGFEDVAEVWNPDSMTPEQSSLQETQVVAAEKDPVPSSQPILETENPIASGRALLDEVTMLRESIERIVANK